MRQFDIFADALWQYYETGKADLRTERDDGFLGREDVSWYFTSWKDFPAHEKQALKFARGRVLDAGCGAGRHSLYLTRRGLGVTSIDVSPRIVLLATMGGVGDARIGDLSRKLPFAEHEFDTVLLLGNNLGIPGTIGRLRRVLRELTRVTSARGRIIATSRMPTTTDPLHLSYLRQNVQSGRYSGEIRLRLKLNGRRGEWFKLLLLAPTDLLKLALDEGWIITHIFPLENFESGYSAVLEKLRR